MTNIKHRVIEDPIHGYRRLDPLPEATDIAQFYESQYYHLIKQGNRAPEIRRLMESGPSTEREKSWLSTTLYGDIHAILTEEIGLKPAAFLDVGCGMGDLIDFLRKQGWKVSGLELSREAAKLAQDKGLDVYNTNLGRLAEEQPHLKNAFQAVTFINVLEHVLDPALLLKQVRTVLAPNGIVAIRVPNDFSELQKHAQTALGKDPWWVAIPDHVNYFDFKSLRHFLDKQGFETVYQGGDFPMELFLLMGEDYAGNPDVGGKVHEKRRRFELAVSGSFRRNLYRQLAEIGVGRDCFIFAKARG